MKIVVALIPLLVAYCVGQCQPWIPVPASQHAWMPWIWKERFQANVVNARDNAPNIQLIFQGDSITEGWSWMATDLWDEHYGSRGGVNYGIGGDSTQHVLFRIQNGETDSPDLAPRLLVLKIGTNNIGWCSEDGIARGVVTIVEEYRRRLPLMRILVLGILPRYNLAETTIVDRINAMVEPNVVEGDMVRFLNMRDTYFNNTTDELRYEMYNGDGLHLSLAGYMAWQQTMDSLFDEMWNL
ncbi:platelet-activating factor acetylhydrolase IB subunit gamma-like [Bradysia coprophila]|uniref:platelet-activating factor acetylhydrolase IB subunit gamma-like n=1 Tax=Bradysia coprophila TaxID=38358 RepID=UPI00187DB6BF|nr:platelet-activating factor acetylhydrolase IB subunit gamma-like [Bradysia coprophila]